MAVWGWANSNEADSALNQTFSSDFVKVFPNWGSYSNPQVDDLLDRAATELDTAKRAELYAQAQQILMEDAAGLFMHWQVNLTGVSQRVDGVFVHIAETLLVRDSGFTG
jgi:peptide/nickel transport system substrate-binding protein